MTTKNKQLTASETAKILRVTNRTLYNWRKKGISPEFHRLPSGQIVYFLNDIIKWQGKFKTTGYDYGRI